MIRGYILDAPAKSSVGIRTPDICRDAYRVERFFYALSTATFALWWGVQGSRKARRVFTAGSSNPVRLTTLRFEPDGGDQPHCKGKSYDLSNFLCYPRNNYP